MTLTPVLTYRLKIRGPLPGTSGSPLGPRECWEMSEGTLKGEDLHATLTMPGGDWYRVGPDGFGRPDVRVQFVTDDGAVIFLHYIGLVEQTDAFKAAASSGRATEWADQYMRMFMTFDTGAARHAWLNTHLFVARGRLAGPQEIDCEIHQVN